ncbi:unnamed protein product [Agarophyton chilense]|eukprot:gb/GEZJ01003758.1/.p1 GENE.gb/GEZJ01003758.1/~~gb/GEZJ01003758.1/.p1  ORF type:complete len:363 (+),score=39.21 gb/GEZJ01003758.1/:295-1383(+)
MRHPDQYQIPPRTTHLEGRTRNGDYVKTIHLRSESGAEASILTRGARLLDLRFSKGPNRLITYNDLSGVEHDCAFVNVVIGRIANRTRGGKLLRHPEIDSQAHLELNDQGRHHIHGGSNSWDKRLFCVQRKTENMVELTMLSPDGDQGYPGGLELTVRYELVGDVRLNVTLSTKNVGSEPTLCNLTLHPYFDLSGEGGVVEGSVLSYRMKASRCEQYLVLDDDNVPNGVIASVQGTRFDFTKDRPIHDGSIEMKGYDNFWIVRKSPENKDQGLQSMVTFLHPGQTPGKGVKMEILSDQHGFQFYTANGFDGSGNEKFAKHGSIAVEPSDFIDAANHDNFPCIALGPSETKTQCMSYELSILE